MLVGVVVGWLRGWEGVWIGGRYDVNGDIIDTHTWVCTLGGGVGGGRGGRG